MIKEFFIEIVKIFHSDHPFMMLMTGISELISSIWKHQIYITSDKQAILVGNVIIALILLIFGIKLARRLSNHLSKKLPSTLGRSTISTLERISYYVFLIITTIFVLDIANVPLTIFAVVGTTIAVGVGLGSQNMANNFISGLIIMIEQPIKLGDIIEVKNITGKVTNIGARCVSVKTPESIVILIPNSHILQDVVINWTHEDNMLKVKLPFVISAKPGGIAKFDEMIYNILLENKDVIKKPAPEILLKGIYKDSYRFEVEFWLNLDSSEGTKHVINDINRTLNPILKEYDIEILEENRAD